MVQSLDDLNNLDQIIQQTIEAIEKSKNQIFDIAEAGRREYNRLQQELENIRRETSDIIRKVDNAEKEERRIRLKLMEVSRDFSRFSEEDIKRAYEDAKEAQITVVLLREQEKTLRRRRDDLELSLKGIKDAVEKAENLVSQVGVVMGFLGGNLQDFSQQIGDVKLRHQLGLGIIKAQEEERKRVARDIHDGPAQSLANVVFRIELCDKLIDVDLEKTKYELRDLKEIVKTGLQEVRRIIFDLRPMALDDLGLIPALRRFVENFQEREEIKIDLAILGKEKELDTGLEIAIFRLVQECLSNVKKHAKTGMASVRLELASQQINVIVEDRGQGFDLEEYKREKKESFGLMGMEERVKLLGGKFNIRSTLGQGTRIIVSFPLER